VIFGFRGTEASATCRYSNQENLVMLTITIIFALLVALWGRLGAAGASRV